MALRVITLWIAASLLLSGCNLANHLRLRSANDHLSPQWPTGSQQQVLNSDFDGEKAYVYGTINGIEGFKLMVDTGAATTMLFDTAKVKKLGLTAGYELSKSGWGDGEDSTAYQTEVKSLSLSGVDFTEVNFAYMPISKSQYFLREDEGVFDGVLGYDILRHFSWRFDKEGKQITIRGPQATFASQTLANNSPAGQLTLPMDIFFSRVSVDVELDVGEEKPFVQELVIDTGSRHYLKLGTAFLEDKELTLTQPGVTAADFGLSGRALHQRVTIPGMKLGNLALKHIKTNVIHTEDEDQYLVLGNALLNQFVTEVDYHRQELRLTPYPERAFNTRYNLLGMELRKITSGDFVVRYVMPDMATATVDIKEGDIITAIDGTPSPQISQEQWLMMSATPGKYSICREREAEQCLALTSGHIAGYSAL